MMSPTTSPAKNANFIKSDHDDKKRDNYYYYNMPFNVGCDEVLFHLGASKYLIINKGDGAYGATKLRIADLTSDPMKKKKKVIRLSLQQWVDLGYWIDDINQIISQQDKTEGSFIVGDLAVGRVNLGGNVFISLKRGLPSMDFCWFWLPPSESNDLYQEPQKFNVHPTKYGIWITYAEWQELIQLRPIVHKLLPALESMTLCAAMHDCQKSALQCSHCNPNGHHVWALQDI